jgi:hypothetical protein
MTIGQMIRQPSSLACLVALLGLCAATAMAQEQQPKPDEQPAPAAPSVEAVLPAVLVTAPPLVSSSSQLLIPGKTSNPAPRIWFEQALAVLAALPESPSTLEHSRRKATPGPLHGRRHTEPQGLRHDTRGWPRVAPPPDEPRRAPELPLVQFSNGSAGRSRQVNPANRTACTNPSG